MSDLLQLVNVSKSYDLNGGNIKACEKVNFSMGIDEVLGIVGESGSGKTTVSNLILGLETPDSGEILFKGVPLKKMLATNNKTFRKEVQAVFQQPLLSLDSLRTIEWSMTEPLVVHRLGNKRSNRARVRDLMEVVGLDEGLLSRYPSQLSGGQLQRVNIARALCLEPELLICDEAVSALDVSVQAQIINLFLGIQNNLGVALLFISHDLEVVRHLSDRIAVMYAGSVIECASTDALISNPLHPYTRSLLAASSLHEATTNGNWDIATFRRDELPLIGCKFAPRCRFVEKFCTESEPQSKLFLGSHESSCVRSEELFLRGIE